MEWKGKKFLRKQNLRASIFEDKSTEDILLQERGKKKE